MSGNVSVKGGVTKSKIVTGPEAHKLHLEFNLSPDPAAALIHRGQPVKLAVSAYGSPSVDYDTVIPCAGDEPELDIIGISTHEQDSAYKGSIVVAVRGYVVVLAKVKGAVSIGAQLGVGDGETTPEVYDETSGYQWVHEIAASGEETLQYGWALESAADGDIIRVLVKN